MPIKNPGAKPADAQLAYESGGEKITLWHRNRDVTRRLLVGAYGVGKTYIIMYELLWLLLKSKLYNGKTALVVGKDHAQNLNVLLPVLKKMLRGNEKAGFKAFPKGSYLIKTTAPITVEFWNGSKIIFLSQNGDNIDGYNPAICVLDEANKAPESVYLSLENRIGRDGEARGMFIIAANPSFKGHWLWERFYKTYYETGEPPEDSYCTTLSLDDSKHVTESRKKTMRAAYAHSPVQYARAVQGQFMDNSGQVYSSYDPDIHILSVDNRPTFENPQDWKFYAGLDFGWHDATAFIFLAFNVHSRIWYAIREYKKGGELIKEHSRHINSIIRDMGLAKRPLIYSEHDTQTRSEYGAVGIHTTPANKDIMPGIDAVNTLFSEHRLFILETCVELKKEVEAYQWSEKKDAPANGQQDHLLDALRYALYTNVEANLKRVYLPGEMATENPKELKFFLGYDPMGKPEYRTVEISEPPKLA